MFLNWGGVVDDGGVAGVASWAAQVAAPARRAMVQSVAESVWKLEYVFEYGNVIPCVAEEILFASDGLRAASRFRTI
jgi:hypothetical protein